jgi:hypothetical protein
LNDLHRLFPIGSKVRHFTPLLLKFLHTKYPPTYGALAIG